MNCYNGERYLRQSVDSVINQKYQNWELIFWDNISTDSSKLIIDSYKDKRIKYFISNKFTSLGKARNLAINKVKGELIGFLDTDDLWMTDKLDLQVPEFLKDPKVGIVICNTIFFNNKKEKVYYKTPPSQGYVFRDLLKSYFISLETVVIRKESLKNLKYFFNDRYNIIEEFDFLIRLSQNVKLKYVNKVLSKWRIHPNSLTWEKSDLYPKELEFFLDDLILNNPQFDEEFKNEISNLRQNINLKKIQLFIQKKNRKNAFITAQMIKPFFLKYLIFILILFPYSFLRFLIKLSGRLSI
jgi:glycosyltransferase involved in cell wall biosynthesis